MSYSLYVCIFHNIHTIYLQHISRFYVAVRLFSNRSQMTSKYGENKGVAREPLGECVTDVLITCYILHSAIFLNRHICKNI